MAKRQTAPKQIKKEAIVLPPKILCGNCMYLEVNKYTDSIAYCNKIKMPIQTFTEKHCIHKKIK